MFLKISQKTQESTCRKVSFLTKLQAADLQLFLKRDSGTGVFLNIHENWNIASREIKLFWLTFRILTFISRSNHKMGFLCLIFLFEQDIPIASSSSSFCHLHLTQFSFTSALVFRLFTSAFSVYSDTSISYYSVRLRAFSRWYFPQVWLVFNLDDVHYTFCIKLVFFLKNFT